MLKYRLYHNPRCSKSRQTLELLRQHQIEPEIILYLDSPPSITELSDLLTKLASRASDLLRKGESIYKEKVKPYDLTEQDLLALMVEYPKLIERPIVVCGTRAVLGRPPENVLELIKPINGQS
ncbi:MAG: arsenate reductase (glutaredoxin) [Cellvibrionales bacterium]|nr:arsenate reductase (glutaredoxin) [Cellvibrionales bacterium]